MILNSPYISGSLTVTGNTNLIGALTVTGSLAGTATSSSFAFTASSAVSAYTAASAVNATTALTASYATSFTVGGTLTAQTLVVQTITSSTDFVTGSTRFGSLLTNTHTFTGSMFVTGSTAFFAGNVGIGTTSPGTKLDVRTDTGVLIRGATSNSDAILSFLPTTGGRQYDFRNFGSSFAIVDSSANVTRMYFNFNGNTGIGLTDPSALLHISGSGSGSLMRISSHASSNIFFVSGSGNVGIGTVTPTERLDVIGGAVAAGNGTIRTGITYSSLGLIGTFTNHDLGVITNGTTRLTISSSGAATFLSSVGVGNVTPYSILSLPSGTGWNGGLSWNYTTANSSSKRWWINTDQIVYGDFRICTEINQGGGSINNAATLYERFYIGPTGNVGIGTTSPSTVFHVNGSSSRVAIITTSGALSSGFYDAFQMLAANQTGGGLSLNVGKAESNNNLAKMVYFHSSDGSTSNRLGFGFYGADGLVNILASGNVGIGNTNARTRLQVTPTSNAETPVLGTANGIATFTSANTNYGLQLNSTSDGTFFMQSQRFDASATAYALGLNPVGGYVYLGKGWGASNHRINLEVAQGNNILVVSGYSGASNDSVIIKAAAGANPNATTTVMEVTTNSSTGRSISAGGTINASGTDYAEYIEKAVTDTIAKGDIIGVNSDAKLTNIFADAISFVVKSTDPSYVGGDAWGNIVGKRPERTTDQTEEEFAPKLAEFEARLETARAKVDRIAFSGQVPCNVTGAAVGDYIIPVQLENGKIGGQAITNPTFEQYQISVGKVWKIMEDGRTWIAVKIG